MKSRRLPALALVALSLAGVSACGNKVSRVTEAKTEGTYVEVGPLKYQVQISRQLNAASVEDRAYFNGVAPADRVLKPNETWFAVFVRVENPSKHPARSADQFAIKDTQDNIFQPVGISTDNPLAYHAQVVSDGHHLPDPDAIAATSPTQGELLLFKLPTPTLDNRPLVFEIHSPTPPIETGTVNLDV